MQKKTRNYLKSIYSISDHALDLVIKTEEELEDKYKEIEDICTINQAKVIRAMQEERLHSTDFSWTTGYGYDDLGRDKTEKIFAKVFKGEEALVRPSIASGTHALSLILFSLLERGERMLSVTGKPYDTLLKVIGVEGDEQGSLLKKGIIYDQIDMNESQVDYPALIDFLDKNEVKLAWIQRSTGYSDRRALTIDEIENVIKIIRDHSDAIIAVDNCYGEFVEEKEPLEVGADIIAGSLIKNPGGGLALSGGYICGKASLIEKTANELTAPGLGKEVGLSFGTTRTTLQGLFQAPTVTKNAVKGATLFSKLFYDLGYQVTPSPEDKRSDIITAIKLENPENILKFCSAIQNSAAVDSDAKPIAAPMTGYEDQVVMASGSFIDGSSIEISADGPIRQPYYVYYQGGMVYDQIRIAAIQVVDHFI